VRNPFPARSIVCLKRSASAITAGTLSIVG
jgi:hypothetical protein